MNILEQHFSRHKSLTHTTSALPPAPSSAESAVSPMQRGLRDPFPHGLLRTTPLKEPCGFEAGDSDGVVERTLSSASFFQVGE